MSSASGPDERDLPSTCLLGRDEQADDALPPRNQMPSSGSRRDSCGSWTVGTEGHEIGRCKGPCKFLRSGRGCQLGEKCRKCHYAHPEVSSTSIRRKKKTVDQGGVQDHEPGLTSAQPTSTDASQSQLSDYGISSSSSSQTPWIETSWSHQLGSTGTSWSETPYVGTSWAEPQFWGASWSHAAHSGASWSQPQSIGTWRFQTFEAGAPWPQPQ